MDGSKEDRASPRKAVPIMELLPKNGLVYSEKANFSEVRHRKHESINSAEVPVAGDTGIQRNLFSKIP